MTQEQFDKLESVVTIWLHNYDIFKQLYFANAFDYLTISRMCTVLQLEKNQLAVYANRPTKTVKSGINIQNPPEWNFSYYKDFEYDYTEDFVTKRLDLFKQIFVL